MFMTLLLLALSAELAWSIQRGTEML